MRHRPRKPNGGGWRDSGEAAGAALRRGRPVTLGLAAAVLAEHGNKPRSHSTEKHNRFSKLSLVKVMLHWIKER